MSVLLVIEVISCHHRRYFGATGPSVFGNMQYLKVIRQRKVTKLQDTLTRQGKVLERV